MDPKGNQVLKNIVHTKVFVNKTVIIIYLKKIVCSMKRVFLFCEVSGNC